MTARLSRDIFESPNVHARDLLVAISAAGLLAIVIFSDDAHLRLTYDSQDYITASNSLDTYLHGSNPDGFRYLVRAPLLPAFLHFFDDKIFAAALLNCICFGICMAVVLKVGRIIGLRPVEDTLIFLVTAFSLSFLQNFFFLWTEPLFSALVLLTCYAVMTRAPLPYILLLLTAAFFCRKAGGFVVLASVAVQLFQKKNKDAIITSAALAIVFVGWEVLVIHHTGTSDAVNIWHYAAGESRIPYFDSLSSWLLPRLVPTGLRWILIAGALAFLYAVRKKRFINFWADSQNKELLLFWLVYITGFIVFGGPASFEDAERFLSIVLPLFMLTIFSFSSYLAEEPRSNRKFFYAAWALWLVYPITRTVYYLIDH